VNELSNCVAVVEGVDDWTDFTYVLCNNSHSQFLSEKGNVVGRKLKELKHIDLKPTIEFIGLCKSKLAVLSTPTNLNQQRYSKQESKLVMSTAILP
jgi:hypothetical protein